MEKEHKNFEKQLEELVEEMSSLIVNELKNLLIGDEIHINRKNMDYPKLRDYGGEQMQIKSVSMDEDNLVFHAQHPVYGEKDHFSIDQISIEQLAFLTEIILDPSYDNE